MVGWVFLCAVTQAQTNEWTWISGPQTPQLPVYGTLGTPAASNQPGNRELSASWTDANGNFWIFGGLGRDSTPVYGLSPTIKQPYSESWNFGLQRSLGHSRALELRYNGNRTIHQWIGIDPNEVNVFENGFLAQFKKAQANPLVKDRIAALAGETLDMPLADIKPFLKAEIAKWADVVKRAHIQVQ